MIGDTHYGLGLVGAPAVEPVTLDEAKAHLRVIGDEEDDLIETLIVAARRSCERFANRALISQQWEMRLDSFPGSGQFQLPRSPLITLDSIKYDDEDGVEQTLGASIYGVDAVAEMPARIWLKGGESWPTTYPDTLEAVRILFTAGYGTDAADVPASIRAALLLLLGNLFENREAVVTGTIVTDLPFGVRALLDLESAPVLV